jgi:xanthine dehydrogenase/oxidase
VLDEEVFVSSLVECVGSLVGLVVAETEVQAQGAAKLVVIEYEHLQPTIFTIDQAIQHDSYFEGERAMINGDIETALRDAEHTLEGELYIGGQEHFYLETNCCIAQPNEDGELTLFSSTQSPAKVQELTALALGIDSSKITCHVRRMGGGFGGKQTRS